ncbi:MAG: DUF1015 domain-containing protein [bacterium]|jgi:uncharacterized protein (DUF1015 family)
MAKVFPFRPYRYSAKAGRLEELLTQPYDKITPEMQARYLSLNPNNLVRIELGPSFPGDGESDNVYTRAARTLDDWIASGVLERDEKPGFFPYFQEFESPDTGEVRVRKGFIGLGAVEDYSSGWVFRHEQTHSGPKRDRLELLRHTHAHTGQLFMLYDDRHREIDSMIEAAAAGKPIADLRDELGVRHTLWRIIDVDVIGRMQRAMADKKLIIADGHHRYETALAYYRENPAVTAASRVMMTFVNIHSPGLAILATHRVVAGLPAFDPDAAIAKAREAFSVQEAASAAALTEWWKEPHAGACRFGLAAGGRLLMLETPRPKETLDVTIAHERVLGGVLGVTPEDVQEQRYVRYVRGLEAAIAQVRSGEAQAAVLLEPTPVSEVARVAFSGGVMPQKSTDFYPKLLSGLTIYKTDA